MKFREKVWRLFPVVSYKQNKMRLKERNEGISHEDTDEASCHETTKVDNCPWIETFVTFFPQPEDFFETSDFASRARMSSLESSSSGHSKDQDDKVIELLENLDIECSAQSQEVVEDEAAVQEQAITLIMKYIMSTETPNYDLIFRVFHSLRLGNEDNEGEVALSSDMTRVPKRGYSSEDSNYKTDESITRDRSKSDASTKTALKTSHNSMQEIEEKKKKKMRRQSSLLDRMLKRTRSTDSEKKDQVCHILQKLTSESSIDL